MLNKKEYPHFTESYTEEDIGRFSELTNSILFAGDILKKRRIALSVTQASLAEASELSVKTISLVENNESISLGSLKKILLGITVLGMKKQIELTKIRGCSSDD